MKHIFETKVYYADTDAYGVVWHGTYLRWMEKGRVDYCAKLGLNLVEMKNMDIALPVTNMNVRYKSSAKLDDTVVVETWIASHTGYSVTFHQEIKNKETGRLHIKAIFDVVAVNSQGRLYRQMPDAVAEKIEKGMECPVCA